MVATQYELFAIHRARAAWWAGKALREAEGTPNEGPMFEVVKLLREMHPINDAGNPLFAALPAAAGLCPRCGGPFDDPDEQVRHMRLGAGPNRPNSAPGAELADGCWNGDDDDA